MSKILIPLRVATLCAAVAGAAHALGAPEAASAASAPATSAALPAPGALAVAARPPSAKPAVPPRGAVAGASRTRATAEQQKQKERDEAEREALREADVRRLETAFAQAMSAHEYKEASRLLAALRERLPDTRLGVMRRAAWLHQAEGDLSAARSWLERLVARLPNDLNAQLNLALIEAREGRPGAAIERVRALKFHHPHSPTLDHVLSLLELG